MANQWGHALRLSIFGESHGKAIGIIVDGLPPGEAIDLEAVADQMARRAPGNSRLSTARKEPDAPDILSGFVNGKTTGSPLCAVIANTDQRSRDYGTVLRPGHADLTALLKFGGHADMRGGGHFSGRITAPLVFAGAVARQVLARRGVEVVGRIAAVAGIADGPVAVEPAPYRAAMAKELPVCGAEAEAAMRAAILAAKKDCDSVGGVVEIVAFGVPAGLGDPFFSSAESRIAAMLFSVPAVKGVEFGDGFALAAMKGSEANDPIRLADGIYTTESNHNGGILGGITSAMPLVVRAAVKPTASIAKEQESVDKVTGERVRFSVHGRHDPCIVPRALPVAESAVALCLLDMLLEAGCPPERGQS